MRIVFRGIAMVATTVVLVGGVIGCGESNDQQVMDATQGKSKVDPKAPTSYDQLKPKGPMTTPPPGVSLPAPATAPKADLPAEIKPAEPKKD
jgi:hypothetical protein